MKMIERLLLALLLSSTSISYAATAERPMLARVSLHNAKAADVLREGHYDIAYFAKGDFADIVADDTDFQRLQDAGLNPQVIHEDLIGFYQSRFPAATTMGGFRTLSEAIAYMDTLHNTYPSLTTDRDSIGYTYEGRPIWMMKISDNPDFDENEPEFFINGLMHAREPMGMECCLRFMNYLLSNYGTDPSVTWLVDNREFYFVPIINADGYEYNRQTDPGGGGMWRKNRHGSGIDLNRNWGYMWGYDDIGSSPYSWDETYRGTAPFSEPETQSMREFIDSRHFKVIMNFHTYGNDFLYPWGYYNGHTPDNALLEQIADSATAFNGYIFGNPIECLGYYTNGDCNDWQYGEQTEKPKIFGIVMEVGDYFDGFWPDPSRIPTLWNEVLPSLLYLSRICSNPYAVGAPIAPILRPIGVVDGSAFNVHWAMNDTLNPAVAFELKELTGLQRVTDNLDLGSSYWMLSGFYRTTARHYSGSYSLFSDSYNNYNASAILVNPVTVNANDTLSFWTWYSIEPDYDYAYVQLSTDGGSSFINLPGNITTNTDPHGNNLGNGITGNSTNWVLAQFPLGDYARQSVILGLRYRTDGGVLYEGFYADDFFPVETFQHSDVLGSDITDTIFTVTGREEGQYYYQVRARDAESQWSLFSNREMADVQTSSPPDINIEPDSIYHQQQADSLMTYRNDFYIVNNGGGTLNYTTSNTLLWVIVNTTSGSIPPGGRDSVDISITTAGIPPGEYLDSVTITSNDPDQPIVNRPKIVIAVTEAPIGCSYVVGDIGANGIFNGLDVTYGVSYFKGGPPPAYSCECTPGNIWYVSGDVNASCSFNGLDITYMVAYFKGGPLPVPCPDCPPERR